MQQRLKPFSRFLYFTSGRSDQCELFISQYMQPDKFASTFTSTIFTIKVLKFKWKFEDLQP